MPEGEAVISLDHAFDAAAFLRAARGFPGLEHTDASAPVAAFLRQYQEDAVAVDLEGLALPDLLTLAAELWAFGAEAGADTHVRIRAARDAEGGALGRDVLEIATPDRPFVVESVMGDVAAQGLDVLAMFHPIATRAKDARVSTMQVHLRPMTETQRRALTEAVRATLRDVHSATADWKKMLAELGAAIGELEAAKGPGDSEKAEALAFLRWLADDHFVFLGARAYRFRAAGKDAPTVPEAEDGAGLGVLRDPDVFVLRHKSEPALTRDFLREPTPVVVAKSNMRSRVHRRVIADYISVKRYSPAGEVTGERRFVGLFTADAYNRSVTDVPLVRRKAQFVMDTIAGLPGDHRPRRLRNILETYPRDELFQISQEDLLKFALALMHLEDRPRPRLFLRHDRFDRFVSAIVYLPRERYSADLREEIGELIRKAYQGRMSAFYPHFSDGVLARVQFIIGLEPGEHPTPDPRRLEQQIADLARSWEDALEEHLRSTGADESTRAAAANYAPMFDASYRMRFSAADALADIRKMEALGPSPDAQVMAFTRPHARPGDLRFKVYHAGEPLVLSRMMPILETMGLTVVWEQGFRVACGQEGDAADDSGCIWIHDFKLAAPKGADGRDEALRARFEDAFLAVWRGDSEADRFNTLVLTAGADWRDAAFLRTLARYRRQTDLDTSQHVQEEALAEHPEIARLLLALRDEKFDPAADGGDIEARRARVDELIAETERALDAVESLDFDRALRRMLAALAATTRTNFFQRGKDGRPKPHIALKIASREIADLPAPKPYREIFVWAPDVEGAHLRFGPVARGGLRWSDRRDDFRTEVLGLVKAQQVKNAVIVPVGSKGGFYPKRLPREGGREAVQAAAIDAYTTFIRALLDVTDNIAGGNIAPPGNVVRWDGDDPYLVVAADKGTAAFSDIANGIAAEYGFWLGDAFASGGSAGYDHKAMGITARGAWEAVKRHFREAGKDIQSEPFTVIGVGDMSGDVFGNGMLLSKQIKLIAAFDHRDIFIDPDPDPAAGWEERRRLFALPRSSWRDYDKRLISEGGGVFSRAEKSIALTPRIKAMTGLEADAVTPAELIRALLTAECELLWFGGIGTYVKASTQQHADAGDKANDSLRVDARDVRARVIGEGANLAVTQRARIEFARAGGRINTDAVDNSAGVDTSDHEVNIKILLNGSMDSGVLAPADRNPLLTAMTEEVARHVLRHNYDQTLALTLAQDRAAEDLDAHERLMQRLEEAGRLDRAVERLPDAAEIEALRQASQGLTRPEIAVLIAYAKIALFDDLVASDLPDDPYFEAMLKAYFPDQLAPFEGEMRRHRLRREIVATQLANDMINLGGPTFVTHAQEMTGAAPAEIARAFECARRVFRYDALTDAINALDNEAPAGAQTLLHRDTLALLGRQTQWLARRGLPGKASVADTIAAYREGVDALKAVVARTMSPFQTARMEARVAEWIAAGAPEALAREAASLLALTAAPDIIDLATENLWPAEGAAFVYHRTGGRFAMDEARAGAAAAAPGQHWGRLAALRLIEGIYAAQRRLARSVIAHAGAAGGPLADGAAAPDADWAEGAIDAWVVNNARAAQRAEDAIAALRAGGWTLEKAAIADAVYREFADSVGP